MSTLDPRRARWDFWGVLDDTLFLYLEFDMNKYLKNWGNYEVLQIELRKFIVTIFFLFMKPSLCCDVFACNFGIWLYWVLCICLSQSYF